MAASDQNKEIDINNKPTASISLDEVQLSGYHAAVAETTNIAETSTSFTTISLDGNSNKKKKQPRRILHFSDGILEEYSTDEEEEQPPPEPPVDPKTLTWGPWFAHYTIKAAANTLYAADFCGEKLAWALGITSPKYQYAIDEYYRQKRQEEEEMQKEEEEREIIRNGHITTLQNMEGGQTNLALVIDENHFKADKPTPNPAQEFANA